MTDLLIGLLFLLGLVFVAIRMSLCVVTINGSSMFPELGSGDRVLLLRRYPHWLLRAGQIVVADLSKAKSIPSPKPAIVVKRLIGLPGSIVKFHASQVDRCTFFAKMSTLDDEGYFRMQVPDGHLFVQADGKGSDSRHWGPIPFQALVGVVIKRMTGRGDPYQQKIYQEEYSSAISNTKDKTQSL